MWGGAANPAGSACSITESVPPVASAPVLMVMSVPRYQSGVPSSGRTMNGASPVIWLRLPGVAVPRRLRFGGWKRPDGPQDLLGRKRQRREADADRVVDGVSDRRGHTADAGIGNAL